MSKKPNVLAILFIFLLGFTLYLNYSLFGLIALIITSLTAFLSGVVAVVFAPFPVIVRIKSRINLRLHG